MSRTVIKEGKRILSNLGREIFRPDDDPQLRTDIQRQWLGTTDPALKNYENLKARVDQTNLFDNQNSLCLGEGQQLAEMIPRMNKNVSFSRKGSEITYMPNQVITRK